MYPICLALVLAAAPFQGDPASQLQADVFSNDDVFDDELFDDGLDDLLGGIWNDEGEASDNGPLRGVKGHLELTSRLYTAGDSPAFDSEYRIEGELELEFDLTNRTSAYLRQRIGVNVRDSKSNRFEPFEGYVTYEQDTWDLRVGQFVENWGIADTFNPIDILNRRDLSSDLLDSDRLGELGVRWRSFMQGNETFGEPTVSAYALPVFRRTPFATDDSRFSISSLGMPFDEEGGEIPTGIEGALFGVRLQSTLQTRAANADLQFLVARGPEHMPVIGPRGGELVPFYFGTTTVGGGLRLVPNSDVLGDFLSTLTLKAELAFKDPYRFDESSLETPADYLQYAFGVDRLFPNLFADGDQLTTTIEYVGETGASDSDLAARLRPFRSDFVLRGFWELNDFSRTSLEARAILDTELNENIYEFIFERQLRSIHEDLKLITAVQVFDADDTEGLFSALPDNTNGRVSLRFEL
ncbi:MAG: hypothetical protein ACI8TQ_000385 [Planctomycetota bacterium]|jgi:hypothetical protein